MVGDNKMGSQGRREKIAKKKERERFAVTLYGDTTAVMKIHFSFKRSDNLAYYEHSWITILYCNTCNSLK